MTKPMRRFSSHLLATAALLLASPTLAAPPTPPPLDAYGDLPAIEDAAISPNGGNVAIAGSFDGERKIVVTGPDGAVLAVAGLGAAKMRGVSFVGNDTAVMVTSTTKSLWELNSTNRAELYGALLLPLTPGRKVEPVFGRSQSVVDAIFGSYGVRQIGGQWYAFYRGLDLDRNNPYSLYKVDPTTNKQEIVVSGTATKDVDWLIDESGNAVARLEISENGTWELVNARGAKLASGIDKLGAVSLTALGRDGTTAVYSITDRSDPEVPVTRNMEVPLSGAGTASEFLQDKTISRFFVDRANGRLLGYTEEANPSLPVLFDPAKQSIFRKVYKAFGSQHVSLVDWTPDLSHFIVTASGSGNAGTSYLVDMARMKADPIGFERPQIAAAQVGPISKFAYKASDGLDIDAVLTLPPGREAKSLPVIILPHGGPHAQDEVQFDWWAQAFASRGYAVLQPNFRGSTNHGDAFMAAGYRQWGRKMQTDLSDGLAALAEAGIADPRRACIMGASYGGYAALAGVTLQQGIYRCAVSVAGVSDLRDLDRSKFASSGGSYMTRANWRETLGPPSGFDAVSPRQHASAASAPILLIHGDSDLVVDIRHSSLMSEALSRAKKTVEFVRVPGEDHFLTSAATRKQMLQAAMNFVLRNNPPD